MGVHDLDTPVEAAISDRITSESDGDTLEAFRQSDVPNTTATGLKLCLWIGEAPNFFNAEI